MCVSARAWITVTLYCLGPGISELRIEESSIEGATAQIAYNVINLDVNQIESAAVGGVASSINKLEIISPYLALAGLIVAVSTVYVIKKRKD